MSSVHRRLMGWLLQAMGSPGRKNLGPCHLCSSPPGFSTFWTIRIRSRLRYYSSFGIRIRILKFHISGDLTPTQSYKEFLQRFHGCIVQMCEKGAVIPDVSCTAGHQSTTITSHQFIIRLNTTWCQITFVNCELSRSKMWCCCAYFAVIPISVCINIS